MDGKAISGLLSRIKSLCDEVEAMISSEKKPLTREEYLEKPEAEREEYDKEEVMSKEKKEEEE